MKRILVITLALLLVLPTFTSQAQQPVNVYVSGQLLTTEGKIINSSTLVPLRVIFEHLGAKVDWNNRTKTVIAKKDQTTIQLTIGSKMATKNDSHISLRTAAMIINQKTMVPIRFISESFGSKVDWDSSTKSVFIDGKVDTINSYEEQVVQLTNKERTERGLAPLKLDRAVGDVARKKSQDMINQSYFNHQSPTYGSPFEMLKSFGIFYTMAGENIAAGYPTPIDVVDGWMNSEGHRKNILNGDFTHIGVGYAQGGQYQHYITQMFVTK